MMSHHQTLRLDLCTYPKWSGMPLHTPYSWCGRAVDILHEAILVLLDQCFGRTDLADLSSMDGPFKFMRQSCHPT